MADPAPVSPSPVTNFGEAELQLGELFEHNPLFEDGDDILEARYGNDIDQLFPEISFIGLRRSGAKYGVTAILASGTVAWQGIPKMGYRT